MRVGKVQIIKCLLMIYTIYLYHAASVKIDIYLLASVKVNIGLKTLK